MTPLDVLVAVVHDNLAAVGDLEAGFGLPVEIFYCSAPIGSRQGLAELWYFNSTISKIFEWFNPEDDFDKATPEEESDSLKVNVTGANGEDEEPLLLLQSWFPFNLTLF